MKKFMHYVAAKVNWNKWEFADKSDAQGIRCFLCDKKVMGIGYHFTHKETSEGIVLGPGCYQKARFYIEAAKAEGRCKDYDTT